MGLLSQSQRNPIADHPRTVTAPRGDLDILPERCTGVDLTPGAKGFRRSVATSRYPRRPPSRSLPLPRINKGSSGWLERN